MFIEIFNIISKVICLTSSIIFSIIILMYFFKKKTWLQKINVDGNLELVIFSWLFSLMLFAASFLISGDVSENFSAASIILIVVIVISSIAYIISLIYKWHSNIPTT